MSAEHALQAEQFGTKHGPWTEVQTRNMDRLTELNDIAKKRRAGKPDQFAPGVSDRMPIRSPQNWY